jgi:cytochrome c biogenesis protein CcdA
MGLSPGLVIAVAAIALPDSLNPSLIVADLYYAIRPYPGRQTAVFTGAAFVVTLAGGVAIGIGLGDLVLSLLPKPGRTLKYALMEVAGVVLVCAGAAIWLRRRSLAMHEQPDREHNEGVGAAAVVGAGLAGLELLTAFPYFAAIALVAGSSASAAGKLFLLLIYNLVYFLPLIAIVIVCGVMGERGGRKLAPIGEWIATRWPVVVAPLALAAGIGLIIYATLKLS